MKCSLPFSIHSSSSSVLFNMRSSVAFAAAASVASISSVAAQSRPTFTVSCLTHLSARHVNLRTASNHLLQPTEIKGHFVEQFTPDWEQRWSASKATKEEKAGEVSPTTTTRSPRRGSCCLCTRAVEGQQAAAPADPSTLQVFSYVGKWSVEEPTVYPGIEGDEGLVLKTKAAHHAISAPFETPLDPKGKTIVAQYEVKLQKGLECGGAYIKLLTDSDVVSSPW